jgi:ubiquinone/menaquinone biosynthesis C-methylase UbiE
MTTTLDLGAIKQRQQTTWASGDYSAVAARIHPMAERLIQSADLPAGARVLDVATGSGNAAIAAARSGCRVTGVDYVPSLLADARRRAMAEGLAIEFTDGDAEALPFPDASFDAVLSCVGAMFAPDQEKTAAEIVRVCRPGGTIALASWTPDGFIGDMFRTVGRHVPPPAGLRAPVQWGTESRLEELFGAAVTGLNAIKRDFVFRFETAEEFPDFFRTNYGPTLKAFEAAADTDALYADLVALARKANRSSDTTIRIPSTYLEVVTYRAS